MSYRVRSVRREYGRGAEAHHCRRFSGEPALRHSCGARHSLSLPNVFISEHGRIIHAPVPEPAMFPIFMSVVFALSDLNCRENMRI